MNERVERFFNNMFEDPDVDFITIANGYKMDKIRPPVGKVLERDNIGYDFGAWSDVVLNTPLTHDYYFFINSSSVGPFYKGNWLEPYIRRFQKNVKLVGSTINAMCGPSPYSHVQSYAFMVDKETLEYLIDRGIFSNKYVENYTEAVFEKEIRMSTLIMENKWNIGSLLRCYDGVDFSDREANHGTKPFYRDVMTQDYENVLWKREDLVFIKGNRAGLKIEAD